METYSQTQVVFFAIAILFVFLLIFGIFFFSYWLSRQEPDISPYSGMPLRKGSDLSFAAREKILRVFFDLHDFDNQMIDIQTSAICRETGRIFPNALTVLNRIKVGWVFLKKKYPGDLVSWGSLTEAQQLEVRSHHDSLEGFQTGFSCSHSAPEMIEPEYALTKPGPLYVDYKRKVLLGWKCVPETNFEVLIIQKPVR